MPQQRLHPFTLRVHGLPLLARNIRPRKLLQPREQHRVGFDRRAKPVDPLKLKRFVFLDVCIQVIILNAKFVILIQISSVLVRMHHLNTRFIKLNTKRCLFIVFIIARELF